MSRATGNNHVRDRRDLVDGGSELAREDVLIRVSKDIRIVNGEYRIVNEYKTMVRYQEHEMDSCHLAVLKSGGRRRKCVC